MTDAEKIKLIGYLIQKSYEYSLEDSDLGGLIFAIDIITDYDKDSDDK